MSRFRDCWLANHRENSRNCLELFNLDSSSYDSIKGEDEEKARCAGLLLFACLRREESSHHKKAVEFVFVSQFAFFCAFFPPRLNDGIKNSDKCKGADRNKAI